VREITDDGVIFSISQGGEALIAEEEHKQRTRVQFAVTP
jgi:hypothetical protein